MYAPAARRSAVLQFTNRPCFPSGSRAGSLFFHKSQPHNKEGIMKRIIGLLTLTALLITQSLALAAEQIGVYVAPKFIYGFTQMQGMKTTRA